MRLWLAFFSLFAVCLLSGQATEEAGRAALANFTSKQYKGHPQNWAVLQDHRGLMYIGNNIGLMEYDGLSWTWVHQSIVRSMAIDKHGVIFVGGVGEIGFLSPDKQGNNRFVSLMEKIPPAYREFGDVWNTYSTAEGVYFNAVKYLFLWDGKSMKVWESRSNFHLAFLVRDTLYIREWEKGLLRMEKGNLKLLPGGDRFASERIYVMLPYNKSSILVGSRAQGLFLWDGNRFNQFASEADAFLKTNPLYLPGVVLPNGQFALGTMGGGVAVIDWQGRLIQKLDRRSGLQDNTVYFLYADREGNVWLALDKGVSKVNISSPLRFLGVQEKLESAVNGIAKLKDKIYISTTNGVQFLDPVSGRFSPVSGINNQTFDLLTYDGELLAAFPEGGVMGVSGDAAKPVRPSKNYDFRAFALHRSIKSPTLLWVGLEDGLALLRKSGTGWMDLGRVPGISEAIRSIREDKDGNIWLGTQFQGLLEVIPQYGSTGVNLQTLTVKRFGPAQGFPEGQAYPFVVEGRPFFLSSAGIFTFDPNRQRFLPDTLFREMGFGPAERALAEGDQNGNIWLNFGKESGVLFFQRGKYILDKSPFQPFKEWLVQTIFPDDRGVIWFGTDEGLIRYDKQLDLAGKKNTFNTLIRKIRIGEDSLLYGGAGPLPKTVLPFRLNRIQLTFAATSFSQSEGTVFETWMENFDSHWSAPSDAADKEYTNLPPGKYVFRVRARNIFNEAGEEASFELEVLPPWYRSWWAIFGYIFLTGVGVYYLIRWRTWRLQEKQRELEQIIQERTQKVQEQARQQEALFHLSAGIASAETEERICEAVVNGLKYPGLGYFHVAILGMDQFTHDRILIATSGNVQVEKGMRIPSGKGLSEKPLLDGKINYTPDVSKEDAYVPSIGKGSELDVPIRIGEEIVGVLVVENETTHAFVQKDMDILTTAASQMGIALGQRRSYKAATQRAEELATVNRVSKAMVSQLNQEDLIQLVGDQLRDLFQADIVYLALLDEETHLIHFPYQFGDAIQPLPFGQGLTSQIIKSGQHLLINRQVAESYAQFGLQISGREAASYLGVPIPLGQKVIGVLSVQSTAMENRFGESDQFLLSTIATYVGMAMQNARLFEAAERARAVAEEANEAKSNFLSTVSHELRTPLTSILGFAKIIRKKLEERIFSLVSEEDSKATKSANQVRESLDVILSEGQRLTGLINDLLDLAKIEAGHVDWKMESIQIEEVIRRAALATHSLFSHKALEFRQDIPEGLPVVTGDQDKLIQVMINLLSNAIKFTDKGQVTCQVEPQENQLIVRVIDTGIGISVEDQSKVFDKFKQVGEQLTDKPKGTGLGLPICREIIHHHGGKIWVESLLGAGSTFVFTLPVKPLDKH
ncbi:MAG: GAF domain-containing protein [Haliscomenobacter sp.]|nr:GAF domain-containing protein [Haliscomenobacter sp.]